MSQADLTHSFTKVCHSKPYPAISPSLPHLSAAGKTVLITGGSQGIGLAIAKAFATAGASHLILLARRDGPLAAAKSSIEAQSPSAKIHTFAGDVADLARMEEIFKAVRADIGEPDILVLSAGYLNPQGPALALSPEITWKCYEINVKGNMNLVRAYLSDLADPSSQDQGRQKAKERIILNVSTISVHYHQPGQSAYGSSKEAFLQWITHVQNDYATHGLRVHSFHPGMVYTDMLINNGMPEEFFDWDDADLGGHFSVWLASEEAAFLAGRFVWAGFDVDELKARADEIKDSPNLLKIGLIGDAPFPKKFPIRMPLQASKAENGKPS